jgi:hypothetical protein
MFMPDITSTLKNLRNTLVQNGRISAAVWSSLDKVPSFRLPIEIIMKETGTPPSTTGLPGPFALADTNVLRQKFQDSGFHDIKIENGAMHFKMISAAKYIEFVQNTSGTLGTMMASLSASRRQEIWNKVAEAARKQADPQTGKIEFKNEVIYVSARH